ncbi:hypothetical protein JHL22_03210 [Advenella sp. WQ 585]|uniref:Tripartite tricarboxylate transporter family receptor n=1 Tax=Advenella mandrilli TaxID=2800330 RepID=A0ABS1EBJ3_9BURK|nr:hypothetical protein [Advenella mandrilli]
MWPEIPPTTDSGITGVEAELEFLVTSPAGTPPEIVNLVSDAINSISQEETFRENLQKQGLEPAYMDATTLLARRQNDNRKWEQVIAQSGIEKE